MFWGFPEIRGPVLESLQRRSYDIGIYIKASDLWKLPYHGPIKVFVKHPRPWARFFGFRVQALLPGLGGEGRGGRAHEGILSLSHWTSITCRRILLDQRPGAPRKTQRIQNDPN